MLSQFKTVGGNYSNQHNSVMVPIPSNVRTNSSNVSSHVSTNSGTASKKVTFSYYNDDAASGAISVQNINPNAAS